MQERLIFFTNDAIQIAAQLAGEPLSQVAQLVAMDHLRSDISTDEITPLPAMVHFDERLGRHAYTGLSVGGVRPIGLGAMQQAACSVVVAGARYGKGSSREHSPVAEKSAGVRLVIAKSFERIYRQNADNIGLLTSTDFGLIDQLKAGVSVASLVDEILRDREPLAKAILKSGGLIAFGSQHLRKAHVQDVTRANGLKALSDVREVANVPKKIAPAQTYFEKIVARHRVNLAQDRTQDDPTPPALDQLLSHFVRADWRFIHEYYTGMAANLLAQYVGADVVLDHPDSIVVFEDHMTYVETSPAHVKGGLIPNVQAMCAAQTAFAQQHELKLHRTDAAGTQGDAGISHAMMIEHYALPGQVVVGTDSHTPHIGAVGAAAFGVGTTDMANAFVTGAVRLTTPQTLQVVLTSQLPAGVTAKDTLLHLLALPDIRAGLGVGKVFEFVGEGVTAMSTDERATLCNMTAELGGLTGIIIPDAETVRFLKARREVDVTLAPWMHSDAGAAYAATLAVACDRLSPYVAAPGDPGNGQPLSCWAYPRERVRVDIAYGGSCTAGKREDFDQYHAVLAWAAAKGLRVADHVTLYLQCGTTAVRDYCIAQGYMKAFDAVGAKLLEPSCGACANCGPGSSERTDQVTVSAINRNFPGRSGPGSVWLASPPTVAASAIAGLLCSFAELQEGQV